MVEGHQERPGLVDAGVDIVEIHILQDDRAVIRFLTTETADVEHDIGAHLHVVDLVWRGRIDDPNGITLAKAVDCINLAMLAYIDSGGKAAEDHQVTTRPAIQDITRDAEST